MASTSSSMLFFFVSSKVFYQDLFYFDKNLKIGKNVLIDSSPYIEMTQKRISRFKPRFKDGLHPLEVAKVILKAITSDNHSELRYLVGSDAFKLIDIRNNTSDKEFGKIVIKNIL